MLWRLIRSLFVFVLATVVFLICFTINLVRTLLWKPNALWIWFTGKGVFSFSDVLDGYIEAWELLWDDSCFW